ncbi:sterol carrier protein [Amycolatopsis sp. NPDC059021]|uniref:sterol carrier protein n=1 Tax=Amycolatopsis sp. NPDC059021 TaxID=3346704 RepID=UPI00366B6C5E
MAYFNDAAEVYRYLGGMFEAAENHKDVGPKLRAADLTFRVDYSDPAATMFVRLAPSGIEVIKGEADVVPDIRLAMSADIGDRFWRGEYNAAIGLARGEVRARGPISKLLRLIPLTKPLVPLYKDLVAAKDGERT